ncbi:hypothetical protein CBR_g29623 [Chara braunii]|uniref:Uncharacterized protein n=1 Tax=Chara braunii TaxID=69332 RepID=A0A388LAX7_CHABU|nr:hypothetical protein CBR_g29623 [Chara braunii]|eukprot:GBG79477.1 hypothetical protein CBR_g29623 [Chara braunii]
MGTRFYRARSEAPAKPPPAGSRCLIARWSQRQFRWLFLSGAQKSRHSHTDGMVAAPCKERSREVIARRHSHADWFTRKLQW